MLRSPPKSNRSDPLCPHTTLFRSTNQSERVLRRPILAAEQFPRHHDRIFAAVAVRVITAATANLIEPFVLIQGDSVRVAGPYFQKHAAGVMPARSEEHTSELQSLMRISYAVFCLKK